MDFSDRPANRGPEGATRTAPGGHMDIFEELTKDHRLISQVLDAFETFVDTAVADLDLVELNRFAVFFREFVELTHHEREERVLLPAMESLGYARNGAP